MFFLCYDRRQPLGPAGIDTSSIIRKLTPYAPADQSGALESPPIQIIQCVHWNTAASRLAPVPLHHPPTGISLASWARIDNRDELSAKLRLARPEMDRFSDAELILQAYLKWEEDCVSHLLGDFVFALHDPRKEKVFCGRDHLGVRPFYYYLSPHRFVCATNLNALLDLEGVPVEIKEQWLAEYLLRQSMSFERTPYQGLLKLPPAHCLTVTPKTQELRQYFRLADVPELRLKDSQEYVDAYREQLEAAVKCRVETEYPLGSELSGGLDSATVTAYAARFFGQPLYRFHTFSFLQAELDPKYILAVSRYLGLPQTHIFLSKKFIEGDLDRYALEILGYPVEHKVSIDHEPFYRLAETLGIRTLLSGFGGDEFVTTTHGYLILRDLITRHRYKELFQRLEGNGLERLLRLIKLGLKQIWTHNFTGLAYNPRFYQAYARRWEQQLVRQEWVDRFNLKERYLDQARFDAGYTDLKKFTLEKRWLPFVPTRLENCTLMAAARKIEYRWPLLDIRLVRLFLSIPGEEHFHGGLGRYLHRRAIDGVVPDLVTWKRSKDMGALLRADHGGGAEATPFAPDTLHPRLIEVLDVEKLNQRIAARAGAASNDPHHADFRIRRDIQIIKTLDLWLKQLLPVDSRNQRDPPGHNLEA
jgi:asparagine synthase (glutamine-hydrolysing)